jgi:hypothetical protein
VTAEPKHADRVARRLRVVFIASATGLLTTCLSLALLHLILRPQWLQSAGLPPFLDVLFAWTLTLLGGVLAAAGFGYAASWVHQTLWPEHPDDGDE